MNIHKNVLFNRLLMGYIFMIQNQFNYLLIILYHFEFEFLFLGDFSRQPVTIVHQTHFFYKNEIIRISEISGYDMYKPKAEILKMI